MILDAVRESGGVAIAVDEDRIQEWMTLAASAEGVLICPEAAACVGAMEELADRGWIRQNDRVVLFNTGAAQKYPEAMAVKLPRIKKDSPIDWSKL